MFRDRQWGRTRQAAGVVMAALAIVTTVWVSPAHAIIGGNPTTGDAHPYYVRLIINNTLCGGSIIDKTKVLTAAHCGANANGDPSKITVFIRDQFAVGATSVAVHPLWNGNVSDGHDLAVIGIPSGATTGITPVRVGSPTDSGAYAAGVEATMVGRGRTSPSQDATQLNDLHTVLRSDSDMDGVYNPWYWFDHWKSGLMIGAGWTNHTVCYGDSGGPLTVDRNGVTMQVGVASFVQTWPDECAQPGGYAELSGPQLAWVASKVLPVQTSWGPCRTQSGGTGRWYAMYQYSYAPTAFRDGSYYWDIHCYLTQSSTQSTTTTTRPSNPDDPPIPAYCQSKPWLDGCP